MTSRIATTWSTLKRSGQKALIPFITAGFPVKQSTLCAIRTAADSGCDLIEIGVPFSDPLADGPAIQHSSQVALGNGVNLEWTFEQVLSARKDTSVPILLMGYYNPFLQYGLKAFCRDAISAGVDGVIIPDLPPDEAGEFMQAAASHGLSVVFLIAPTTTKGRVLKVARASTDFCYCVSITGVTGARSEFQSRTESYLKRTRKLIKKPMVVGFGISKPAHIKRLGRFADGLVVGSALVPVLEEAKSGPRLSKALSRALKPLVRAAHYA